MALSIKAQSCSAARLRLIRGRALAVTKCLAFGQESYPPNGALANAPEITKGRIYTAKGSQT